VNHAPLMTRPEVAIIGVGADAILMLGSPESVVGEDVGHFLVSRIGKAAPIIPAKPSFPMLFAYEFGKKTYALFPM